MHFYDVQLLGQLKASLLVRPILDNSQQTKSALNPTEGQNTYKTINKLTHR